MSKVRMRCPKCKSVDIYKRTRRVTKMFRCTVILKKVYICRECGNEFNTPFIGAREDCKCWRQFDFGE